MANVVDRSSGSFNPRAAETSLQFGRLYGRNCMESEVYCVPVDEKEQDRMGIQHDVLKAFFGDKLFFGSTRRSPRKVLDCGYGVAHWLVEVVRAYPDCEAIGIDIHAFDVPGIPSNITLKNDDLNQTLTETNTVGEFDVIQSRFVGPGIQNGRWSSYVQELLLLLKPGGWLQMVEYYFNFQSHSGLLGPSHALYEWGQKYRQAMERDKDPRIGSMTRLADLMRDAGFVDVQYQNCSLPIGEWSRDRRERDIGRRNLANFDEALESFGTWPFRSRLGMSEGEVLALNSRAREEARNPRYKTYIPLTVAWARKPAGG